MCRSTMKMNTSLSSLHCYSGKMSQGREVAHLRVINNSHVEITGITRRKIRTARGGGESQSTKRLGKERETTRLSSGNRRVDRSGMRIQARTRGKRRQREEKETHRERRRNRNEFREWGQLVLCAFPQWDEITTVHLSNHSCASGISANI